MSMTHHRKQVTFAARQPIVSDPDQMIVLLPERHVLRAQHLDGLRHGPELGHQLSIKTGLIRDCAHAAQTAGHAGRHVIPPVRLLKQCSHGDNAVPETHIYQFLHKTLPGHIIAKFKRQSCIME